MKINIYLKSVLALFLVFLLGEVSISCAEDLIKLDKALKKIYPQATDIKQKEIALTEEQLAIIADKANLTFGEVEVSRIKQFTIKSNDQIIGHAFEDTVIGKWGPIHYLLGLNPDGGVKEAIVLDYQEIRGKAIAKKRFLRQYAGKNVRNPVYLKKDINGITGATISSRSMTDGVRKLLYVFDEIKQD